MSGGGAFQADGRCYGRCLADLKKNELASVGGMLGRERVVGDEMRRSWSQVIEAAIALWLLL